MSSNCAWSAHASTDGQSTTRNKSVRARFTPGFLLVRDGGATAADLCVVPANSAEAREAYPFWEKLNGTTARGLGSPTTAGDLGSRRHGDLHRPRDPVPQRDPAGSLARDARDAG